MMLVLKAILTFVGILLMLAGVIISPLPGPGGLPVIVLGLIITLRFSPWAKRRFVWLYRRYPKWFGPLRRSLRKRAKVVAIMWHQMLRTERFFGRGRLKVLQAVRRLFRRLFRGRRPRTPAPTLWLKRLP